MKRATLTSVPRLVERHLLHLLQDTGTGRKHNEQRVLVEPNIV
jgi:hypothetical protein